MFENKNLANKSWSYNIISKEENNFMEDQIYIWPQKLTLKSENVNF